MALPKARSSALSAKPAGALSKESHRSGRMPRPKGPLPTKKGAEKKCQTKTKATEALSRLMKVALRDTPKQARRGFSAGVAQRRRKRRMGSIRPVERRPADCRRHTHGDRTHPSRSVWKVPRLGIQSGDRTNLGTVARRTTMPLQQGNGIFQVSQPDLSKQAQPARRRPPTTTAPLWAKHGSGKMPEQKVTSLWQYQTVGAKPAPLCRGETGAE